MRSTERVCEKAGSKRGMGRELVEEARDLCRRNICRENDTRSSEMTPNRRLFDLKEERKVVGEILESEYGL